MVTSTLGGYFAGQHSPTPDVLDAILLACGIDDPAVVRQWHEALGRVRRVPGRRRPRTLEPPYRGLESFRPEDAAWFFGRAALVDAVVAAVRERAGRGPLVVVGASGPGKSSCSGPRSSRRSLGRLRDGRPPALLTPVRPARRPGSGRLRCPTPGRRPVRGGLRPGRRRGRARAFIRALCALDTPVVIAPARRLLRPRPAMAPFSGRQGRRSRPGRATGSSFRPEDVTGVSLRVPAPTARPRPGCAAAPRRTPPAPPPGHQAQQQLGAGVRRDAHRDSTATIATMVSIVSTGNNHIFTVSSRLRACAGAARTGRSRSAGRRTG